MVSKRNSEIFQRVSNLFYPETLAKRCATFELMTANGHFSDLTGRTGEVRVWGKEHLADAGPSVRRHHLPSAFSSAVASIVF
jgi:hypothetical protein